MTADDLEIKVNKYPLSHKYFVVACKIVSEFFHQVARYRWSETIYREVWNFVKNDFEYETGKKIKEDNVDPALRRLFYSLKLYMQTVLFDNFEAALNDYLRFLLSFLLRDLDCREQLRSIPVSMDQDLIPLKTRPFLVVHVVIDKSGVTTTKPDLDKVSKDLFSVVSFMHDALKSMERVDKLIFPLLELEQPWLNAPDLQQVQPLLTGIERAIEVGTFKAGEKIREMNGVQELFERKAEDIILDLKKKTFALQNNMEQSDDEDEDDITPLRQTMR